jgi:hypothetical protein
MKKQYVVPTLCVLRITTHLLSGSGSSANMEGGDNINIGDGETSPDEGRAKENIEVWNNWGD